MRWALAYLLIACGDDASSVSDGGPGADAHIEPGQVEVAMIPATPDDNLDLLLVIDDSPGMAEEQTALRSAFAALEPSLGANYHLGVVTSDLGLTAADGPPAPFNLGAGPGSCLMSGGKQANLRTSSAFTGSFISNVGGVANYTGTLDAAFGSIAAPGATGCDFEQHLQAMRRALDANPANAGFLRPEAKLAVIVVADEDDCSAANNTLFDTSSSVGYMWSFRCTRYGVTCDQGGTTDTEMNQVGAKSMCHSNSASTRVADVARYVTFLQSLKPDPHMVMVGAIAGPLAPFQVELRTPPLGGSPQPALAHTCDATTAIKDPGVRLDQFARSFPRGYSAADICTTDFTPALTEIGRRIASMLGSRCLDRDIAQPPSCTVIETTGNQARGLPACGGSVAKDCYTLDVDPAACPAGQHYALNRAGPAPAGSFITVYCRL